MKSIQNKLLVIILTLNSLVIQSQEGVWINKYSVNTENGQKSNELSNRLMFKIEKDSIFTFDPGKEEWKGNFQMGFKYKKNKNKLVVPKFGIELEYINESKLIFKNQNKVLHFTKVKPQKRNIEKFKKLVSNNIFTSKLTNQKIDTIAFQINRDATKYNFNNVGIYLMEMDEFNSLLFADFKGEKLYEIYSIKKKEFSIIENSKTGSKKIVFKKVKINNLEKFITEEKKMMLSR